MSFKAYSLDQAVSEFHDMLANLRHDVVDTGLVWKDEVSDSFQSGFELISEDGIINESVANQSKLRFYLEQANKLVRLKDVRGYPHPLAATITTHATYLWTPHSTSISIYDTDTLAEIIELGSVSAHLRHMPVHIQQLYAATGQLPQPKTLKRTFELWYSRCCTDCREMVRTDKAITQLCSTLDRI